jgi:hypothetical protein
MMFERPHNNMDEKTAKKPAAKGIKTENPVKYRRWTLFKSEDLCYNQKRNALSERNKKKEEPVMPNDR